jgi:hypothetical protein
MMSDDTEERAKSVAIDGGRRDARARDGVWRGDGID